MYNYDLQIVIVHQFSSWVKDPGPKSPEDQIAFSKLVRRPHLAREAILELLKKDSGNVILHYQRLMNIHDIWDETSRKLYSSENIPDLEPEYEALENSLNPHMRDIGYFGKAILRFQQDDNQGPLTYFDQIKDTTFPEVNFIRGEIAWKKGNYTESEIRYKKEIALKGDTVSSYSALAWMYYYEHKNDKLLQSP